MIKMAKTKANPKGTLPRRKPSYVNPETKVKKKKYY